MVAAMPYPMAKASCIRVGHIVRSLVEQYDDVSVKVFAYQGSESPAAHARVDLRLVGGFDADKTRYYSWSNKLVSDAKLVRALCKERRAFDIIHCHTIEGLGVALAFKLLTGSRVPVCVDVHGPIVDELVHYRLIPNWQPLVRAAAALERAMLRRVGRAFVSNEGLKRYLDGRMDPARVSVVFDYVDLNAFGAHRLDHARVAQLGKQYKANGEKLITFLGMFKDYQGGDYLLKAFARLAPAYPHARLLLVGDGPCRAQYD
jgi:glycosyltransferase involved in cell wall biosynthesis